MIRYDGSEIEATMIITLKKAPVKDESGVIVDDQLRVIIDTEGSRYDIGIDMDDGYPQAADDVQDIVLGRVARQLNWQSEIEKLYQS